MHAHVLAHLIKIKEGLDKENVPLVSVTASLSSVLSQTLNSFTSDVWGPYLEICLSFLLKMVFFVIIFISSLMDALNSFFRSYKC